MPILKQTMKYIYSISNPSITVKGYMSPEANGDWGFLNLDMDLDSKPHLILTKIWYENNREVARTSEEIDIYNSNDFKIRTKITSYKKTKSDE